MLHPGYHDDQSGLLPERLTVPQHRSDRGQSIVSLQARHHLMVHPHRLGCLHIFVDLILLLVVALKIRETRENQSGHAMSG